MVGKRVNGKDLGQHVNENIILLGRINKISSSGQSVEIETCDDQMINVNLGASSLDNDITGYIEVHGKALSKATAQADIYVLFPPEMSQDLDPKVYTSYVSMSRALGNKKWKINAEDNVNYV